MSSQQTLSVPGYQVVQYLGNGARSTIWQIRQNQTGKHFALKRVVKRKSSEARFLDQAINEYTISSQLDHPVIRKVYSLRRIKRWFKLREVHLVMELCEGLTIQESPPKKVVDVVNVFHQVATAIAHMNSKGFIHADMKPNNIMLGKDSEVKIIDLGQSCPTGTIKTRIQGTPDFIAPEQVHRHPLDARTDVYNVGAALYWTLVGKPIPTVIPRKDNLSISDMTITPPIEVNPDIPVALNKLVMDCAEIRPSRRPASMADVASRLGLIVHTLTRPIPACEDSRFDSFNGLDADQVKPPRKDR